MRLWHKDLLPYLPDLQFKGQLRELVLIMHDWRDRGKTNHLLVNRVMEYGKDHLLDYFLRYAVEYERRFGKAVNGKFFDEFFDFCGFGLEYNAVEQLFEGWHEIEYLRVCMANLYEKYKFGIGKSKITDTEWEKLTDGYYSIIGEQYEI